MSFTLRDWRLHMVILLFTATALLARDINRPFIGTHDFNAVDYGTHARNHAELGLKETKLGSAQVVGLTSLKGFDGWNTHHPMLHPLLIALSYKIFGVSEWSTRLMPILFSLGSIAGLYLLGRKYFSPWTGFFAGAFALITPMFMYYGKGLSQDAFVLSMGIWLVYCYGKFLETNSSKYFRLICLLTFLIGITGWPGYFYIPAILLHNLLYRRGKFQFKLLALPIILIGTFSWHILHSWILTGQIGGGGLAPALFLRVGSTATGPLANITLDTIWQNQYGNVLAYFTRPLLYAAIGGLLLMFGTFLRTRKITLGESLILLFLVASIPYPLIFKQQIIFHEFLSIYYLPFLCLGAASLLARPFYSKIHLSQVFSIVFGIWLLFSIWDSGQHGYHYLADWTGDTIGMDLGKWVYTKTKFGDKILFPNSSMKGSEIFYTNFYSDRYIEFAPPLADLSNQSAKNLKQKYDYVLSYNPEPVRLEEDAFLKKNFSIFAQSKQFSLYLVH